MSEQAINTSIKVNILFFFVLLFQGQMLFSQCIPTVFPGVGSSKGISLVTLEQINNPSLVEEGYVDYTMTDTAILYRTGNYSLCLTANTSNQRTVIWVDWNGNGLFDDSIVVGGEMLIDDISGTIGLNCYSFQVPLDAKIGYTDLRVSSGGSNASWQPQKPCNASLGWNGGDYEDYVLEIRSEDSANMKYYNFETVGLIDTCGYAFTGQKDRLMMRLQVTTEFGANPLEINKFTFDANGSTNFSDIANATVYYSGDSNLFNDFSLFGTTSTIGTSYSIMGNVELKAGNNYFWLTYDINPNAVGGNFVEASCLDVAIDSLGIILNKVPNVIISNRPAIILDTVDLYEGCNLIPNPSFEMKTCCPNSVSSGSICYPNDILMCTLGREAKKVVGWEDATLGSTDYFNACNNAINGSVGIPTHSFIPNSYQEARTGDSYIGLFTDGKVGYENYREYFQARLKIPLEAGKEYCTEIYVNLPNPKKASMKYGNQFGMYFSNGKIPLGITYYTVLDMFTPQIKNPSSRALDDTIGWTLISGTFVATGGENYVILGNFENDANTINEDSYYFVEDVLLIPKPILSAVSIDATICSGDSTVLWASGTCNYTWVDVTNGLYDTVGQGMSIKVAPSLNASYIVIGDNGGSTCYDMDTIKVFVIDSLELSGSNDTSICGLGKMNLQVNTTPPLLNVNYSWSPTENLNDSILSIVEATIDTSTTFKVVAQFGSCFKDSLFINVVVNDIPLVSINPSQDTAIAAGERLLLNTLGAEQYLWTPNSNISCTNCSQVEVFPDMNTKYCVIGMSNESCSDTVCVNIMVASVECSDVWIPNVFSPNGDGKNEEICIFGNCLDNMIFRIFNRWGTKVFETDNPEICWDGTLYGKALDYGVFAFSLEGLLITGKEINLKGNITLLK